MELYQVSSSLNTKFSFLNEKVSPPLTNQQKMVLMIALAALSSLAILYYVFGNSYFKANLPLDLKQDQIPSPIQKVTFSNGDIAEGVFINGKLEGQGKITCLEGELLEGLFKEGRLIEGTRIYTKGGSESGAFNEDNQLHGKGKRTLLDGTIEEGLFQNGKLDGEGIIQLPENELKEIGIFSEGRLSKGKRILEDGTHYDGEFSRGRLVKGKILSSDGVELETIS